MVLQPPLKRGQVGVGCFHSAISTCFCKGRKCLESMETSLSARWKKKNMICVTFESAVLFPYRGLLMPPPYMR